jgi:hypothetical protein
MPQNNTKSETESNLATGVAPKQSELEILIRARYPLVYIVSWEEQRVISEVRRIAGKLNKKVFEWSVTMGLMASGTSTQSQKQKNAATQDPLVALDTVVDNVEPALYVFKDFHPFMKCHNMAVIRRLREISESLKNTFKTIVICSPLFELPAELEKDVTVVDFDFPAEREMSHLVDRIIAQVKDNPKLKVDIDNDVHEQIVHALLGLTLVEAENVLAKTLVQNRCLGTDSIAVINTGATCKTLRNAAEPFCR